MVDLIFLYTFTNYTFNVINKNLEIQIKSTFGGFNFFYISKSIMNFEYIKNNKTQLFFYFLLFLIIVNIIFNEPNKYNILVLLVYLSSSIIYYYSQQNGYEFINNNRKYILLLNFLLIFNIIQYINDTLSNSIIQMINTIIFILISFLLYRYIVFSNSLQLDKVNTFIKTSNSYYHTQFLINPFGFYFWYHLLVLFILFSLFFVNWDIRQKLIFGLFIILITLLTDFMYFVGKPYDFFN